MLESVEIIVGTYEEFILGYQVKRNNNEWSLVQTFANHDHISSVRCVASRGSVLVSGGADETIHVYDMAQRKESEILMEHKGTVNCIEITPDGHHFISGGEDGMMAIFQMKPFRLEKSWKSCHKNSGIVGISVHPSGKMALTVGSDATLRTWNLVSGHRVYVSTLGRKNEMGYQIIGVQWNPSGKLYAIGMRTKIDVYNVDLAGVIWSLPSQVRINCYLFLKNNLLVVGNEDGRLFVYDIEEKKCIMEKRVHDKRVKSISFVIENDKIFIATASSTGEIILWEYNDNDFIELARVKSGCRITCLTISSCGFPEVKDETDEYLDDEKKLEEMTAYLLELKKEAESISFGNDTLIIEEEYDDASSRGRVEKTKYILNKQSKSKHSSTSSNSSRLKRKFFTENEGENKSKRDPTMTSHAITPKHGRENEWSVSETKLKSEKISKQRPTLTSHASFQETEITSKHKRENESLVSAKDAKEKKRKKAKGEKKSNKSMKRKVLKKKLKNLKKLKEGKKVS